MAEAGKREGAQSHEGGREMIALKVLLIVAGVLLLATAVALPLYGLWLRIRYTRSKAAGVAELKEPGTIAWRGPVALALVAMLPFLVASSIVVVPSGMGGVRISQVRGTLPGTLYPGVHFVTPLVDSVQSFDLRDHMFTAGVVEDVVFGLKTDGIQPRRR